MHAEPQKEHEWLQKLAGEWTSEMEASMGPDQPPQTFRGTDSVRLIGGLWAVCEGKGDMPGGGIATTIMTIGYDPARKKYVGTFIGSMMTHMWVYEGELNAEETTLTLETEGPNFAAEGKMAKFRDIIEFKSDDHRTLSSYMLTDDGNWQHFMTAHYRRS